MLRSASSSRVAEQLTIDATPPASPPPPPSQSYNLRANSDTDHQLPMYDPLSDVAKKERYRIKFAENAIHAIPVVLVFCAIVLWFFSNPGTESRL